MELEQPREERLRVHRIEPSAPLAGAAEAAAFVRERRIVMATGQSSLPVLSEAIAGRSIHGSWMAQPEVHRIYAILGQLGRAGDLYEAQLVLGKGTIFAAELGPAVQRIAADGDRRARICSTLPPLARTLLERVEAVGVVRMDSSGIPTREGRAARTLLERSLLVVSEGLHTESGRHTAVVRPWAAGRIAREFRSEAEKLTRAAAEGMLLAACLRSAVLAPEREVRRWFDGAGERVEELVQEGRARRLGAGWLVRSGSGSGVNP